MFFDHFPIEYSQLCSEKLYWISRFEIARMVIVVKNDNSQRGRTLSFRIIQRQETLME